MKIIGSGSALPDQVVTNDDLCKILDTSDEWIVTHTGISSRRILKDETVYELGALAAKRALEEANADAESVDLMICSNVISDHVTPAPGCFIAGALGYTGQTLDINGACTGFLKALDVADSAIRAGKARRVLIVAAEQPSALCDWTDRSSCILFGDGAGAVLLEDFGEGECLSTVLRTEFNAEFLNVEMPANNNPFSERKGEGRWLQMNGQEVYRFAVSSCVSDLNEAAQKAGVALESVDWFLLHQANQRILNAARTRLHLPKEKFPGNIATCGNTSSACIPLLIDEMRKDGRLRDGQTIALSAFGAGLTHGAAVLRL